MKDIANSKSEVVEKSTEILDLSRENGVEHEDLVYQHAQYIKTTSPKDDEELSPRMKKAKTTKAATAAAGAAAPANGAPKRARKSANAGEVEEHLSAEKPAAPVPENELALTANPQDLSV